MHMVLKYIMVSKPHLAGLDWVYMYMPVFQAQLEMFLEHVPSKNCRMLMKAVDWMLAILVACK